jgi:hypothetical protein
MFVPFKAIFSFIDERSTVGGGVAEANVLDHRPRRRES